MSKDFFIDARQLAYFPVESVECADLLAATLFWDFIEKDDRNTYLEFKFEFGEGELWRY